MSLPACCATLPTCGRLCAYAVRRVFLLGLSHGAERLLLPSFDFLKQIAIFAWIPLIAMWFGVGETAKIAFIALAAFTPVVVNTIDGIRGAPRHLLEVGAVLTFGHPPAYPPHRASRSTRRSDRCLQPALIYSWLATIGGILHDRGAWYRRPDHRWPASASR